MPAGLHCHWLLQLGFRVVHVPGVSRALRYELPDGSSVLLTDQGGYDLPETSGPFFAIWLSPENDGLEEELCLSTPRQLYAWLQHIIRLSQAQARSTLIIQRRNQNHSRKTIMTAASLGYPRIGVHRQLKKAVEQYWKGTRDEAGLCAAAAEVRSAGWQTQQASGIDIIPSNDFSFYDQMLDMTAMLGAVPERFGRDLQNIDLPTYFAMARGRDGVAAMEMTKWFDTNYHYIVPELKPDQQFRLASTKALDEYREARQQGIQTRPVLIGPLTYLLLSKMVDGESNPLSLMESLVPVYVQLLSQLAAEGADWVQIDEPVLCTDLPAGAAESCVSAYQAISQQVPGVKLMLTTYFGDLGENLPWVASLPVEGLHVDLVRGSGQLPDVLRQWPKTRWLSLGLVDGRNIWRCDLEAAQSLLAAVAEERGTDRLIVATSCSLLHVPHDLDLESQLDADLKSWMAFAKQKLKEVQWLATAARSGISEVSGPFTEARQALEQRSSSPKVRRDAVRTRCRENSPQLSQRASAFPERQIQQRAALKLPLLPTTTIGSFPQTAEIRQARAEHRGGRLTDEQYETFLKQEIALVIREQETLGLDVLVHGEPERNDMVEYFGEQLDGFAFTQHGWVQSYGSRCVKPPVIFGDVQRREPMTVRWSQYAQSLTKLPVKGMLTGPVTILQWSFVRDDQPRSETCRQIAFALRDEVVDLEQAGIRVIQIDEPALREGLPLRRADWDRYLNWACECFRVAASGVADATQIHTHMCYAEFNDILSAIAALDADVISVESSRSKMELLDGFRDQQYPNEIGPGVYDIHSPRVPTEAEIIELLRLAMQVIPSGQIWVNPDCGLKTRGWDEVRESLRNMVAAARKLRG